jgi:hypothetical protein
MVHAAAAPATAHLSTALTGAAPPAAGSHRTASVCAPLPAAAPALTAAALLACCAQEGETGSMQLLRGILEVLAQLAGWCWRGGVKQPAQQIMGLPDMLPSSSEQQVAAPPALPAPFLARLLVCVARTSGHWGCGVLHVLITSRGRTSPRTI